MNCGKKVRLNPNKDNGGGQARPDFGIKSPGDFGPPVMHCAEIAHHGSADHDVVEVGHDEVGAVELDVGGKRGEEKAGESAHGEQADETERIQHGRIVGDRALVESGRPVEDLDGGRNRDHETERRKDQARVDRLAGDEHVMAPDQEAQHRDGHAREGDDLVSENTLARKAGHDLADHAHRGQNHDVNGGVGVEPEQVLEEQGSPPSAGVKMPT